MYLTIYIIGSVVLIFILLIINSMKSDELDKNKHLIRHYRELYSKTLEILNDCNRDMVRLKDGGDVLNFKMRELNNALDKLQGGVFKRSDTANKNKIKITKNAENNKNNRRTKNNGSGNNR